MKHALQPLGTTVTVQSNGGTSTKQMCRIAHERIDTLYDTCVEAKYRVVPCGQKRQMERSSDAGTRAVRLCNTENGVRYVDLCVVKRVRSRWAGRRPCRVAPANSMRD